MAKPVNLRNVKGIPVGRTHHKGTLFPLISEMGASGVKGGLKISCYEYEPGGCTDSEFHDDMEQAYMILDGKLNVTLNGEKHGLIPGSCLHIPLCAVHESIAVGDRPVRVLVISSPVGFPRGYWHTDITDQIPTNRREDDLGD